MSLLSPAQQVSTDVGCQSRCPSALPFSVNAKDGQCISTLDQDARGSSPWVVSWNSPKPPGPGASRRTVRLPHRPSFVSFGVLRSAASIRQTALPLTMEIRGLRQHEHVSHYLNLSLLEICDDTNKPSPVGIGDSPSRHEPVGRLERENQRPLLWRLYETGMGHWGRVREAARDRNKRRHCSRPCSMTGACEPHLKCMQMVGDRLPLTATAQQCTTRSRRMGPCVS